MNRFVSISGVIAFLCAVQQAAWAQQSAPAPSGAGAPGNAIPAPLKIPDTLMFTIDEFNDIQGHLARSSETDGAEKEKAIENASLYLSTILYFGPSDWTIWLNGVAISADQEIQSFKVTEITPNYVELLVPLSAQGMRPVRLGPNQTFITKSGIVVEGHEH